MARSLALVAALLLAWPAQAQYANSIPGSAPYGPSVVTTDRTVLLGQSVGLPDVGRPPPARYCAVAMGGCALEAPLPPGAVCNCRTATGGEIGYAAR